MSPHVHIVGHDGQFYIWWELSKPVALPLTHLEACEVFFTFLEANPCFVKETS